jgi:hypothetical protein
MASGNEELIDHYVDRTGFSNDTKYIIDELNKVDQIFQKLKNTTISFQVAKGGKEVANTYNDVTKAQKDFNAAAEQHINVIRRVSERIASMNGQSKEFTDVLEKETRATLNSSKAKTEESRQRLLNAKASNEEAKGKRDEATASEKTAKAREKEAKKTAELNEPYKQLAIRFVAAAREAKNLAAQYGPMDKRAQAAAKTANELNNQLKKIDSSIGNHQRNVGNYGSALDGVTGKLKSLAGQAVAFLGIFSIGSFFKDSVDEFLQMDKNLRVLQNTLKNIGVPELFERIEQKTKDLQQQFQFLDDDDLLSVFNKLIVYGKLTENQINDLLPVIIDFSAASGLSVEDATVTIIKALEGNGRALKEYGINMKDAKNVTEGFGLIMSELKPKVEGVGKAFGESAAGQVAAAKQEFKDLKEEIGSGLLPLLNKVLSKIADIIRPLRDLLSGNFITGAFSRNENVTAQIEQSRQTYVSQVKEDIELLKKLQSEGKKLEVTEEQILLARIAGLKKSKAEYDAILASTTITLEQRMSAFAEQQALIKAINELTPGGNKVLGQGDPNGGTGKKTGKDFNDEIFKNSEERRKALFEVQKRILQDTIDSSNSILENEKSTLEERIKAAQDFYDFSLMLANKQAAFELDGFAVQENEEKKKANKEISDKQTLANVLISIEDKYAAKRLQVNKTLSSEIIQLNTSLEKKVTDYTTKALNERNRKIEEAEKQEEAHRKNSHETELQNVKNKYSQELLELEDKFNNGLISEKKYNYEKLELQAKQQTDLLQLDIDFTKKTIELAETRAQASGNQEDIDAVAAAKAKLADFEISLASVVSLFKKKKHDEELAQIEEIFSKIAEISSEVTGLVGGFVNALAEKEKNRIQEEIDLLEEKKQKDIEVANQTITNAQDRAAAIAVIEARANAQRQQLEIRQRQADERRARFEKAATIAKIITETALAVVHQLGTGDSFSAIGRAIAVGAIGAAQLAVAIATPIPKYKHGKGPGDRYGGPAIVGDGGKSELIVREDGSMEMTPSKPALTYVKSKDIVLPDAMEALKGMNKERTDKALTPYGKTDPNSFIAAESINANLNKNFKQLSKTIANKKEHHYPAPGLSDIVYRTIDGNKEYYERNGFKNW